MSVVLAWLLMVSPVYAYLGSSRTEALIHEEEGREAGGEGEAPATEKNKHMPCLLAACASGVPRVVTTALDAIVKVTVCTPRIDDRFPLDDLHLSGQIDQSDR